MKNLPCVYYFYKVRSLDALKKCIEVLSVDNTSLKHYSSQEYVLVYLLSIVSLNCHTLNKNL